MVCFVSHLKIENLVRVTICWLCVEISFQEKFNTQNAKELKENSGQFLLFWEIFVWLGKPFTVYLLNNLHACNCKFLTQLEKTIQMGFLIRFIKDNFFICH